MLKIKQRLLLRSLLEGAASVRLAIGVSKVEYEARSKEWHQSIAHRMRCCGITAEKALHTEVRQRLMGQGLFFLSSLTLMALTLASVAFDAPVWVAVLVAALNVALAVAPTWLLSRQPALDLVDSASSGSSD